jgi:hypothetical protein
MEYSIDIAVDMVYSPRFITTIVQKVISGGTTVASNNMRWDNVAITTDPQTIVFRQGAGNPVLPFNTNAWTIAFPLCYDGTGAIVTPVINNRTVNGFDVSIGGVGQIEYIAILEQ